MPYLQNHDHDIFVSYAHGPAPLAAYGGEPRDLLSLWTQRFVDDLRSQIDLYLGIKDPAHRVDIWMDPELEGNRPLNQNLKDKVERSALLLVVMSHLYLDSVWCGQEVEWFASPLTDRVDKDGRVFVVRAFQTDDARWPAALKDSEGNPLPGYMFHALMEPDDLSEPYGWPRPTDSDKEYWKQVARLAQQITRQLKRLEWLEAKQRTGDTVRSDVPHSVGRRVFLGYMHDTLMDVRDDMRRRLVEAGMTVLPPTAEKDPYDEASLREALDAYLGQTEALILVANEYCGTWPPRQEGGFVSFQLQRARERNVSSYLWLQVDDMNSVKKPEYREYLQNLSAQVHDTDQNLLLHHNSAEDFVTYIQDELDSEIGPGTGVEQLAVVCTNLTSDEPIYRSFHELVISTIGETDRLSIIPDRDNTNGQIILKTLEDDIAKSDTIVVVCFDQEWSWAYHVLRELRQLAGREVMRRAKVFVVGPQYRQRGAFDTRAFRFHTVNGINLDDRSIKENLKEAILSALAS